ncbi:hypothetical protein ARMSODRAFT_962256 [Armillaria solidipes]|uniref:C2H2-type domain-containing protein n=2 Tax=Armillaria TaxID=47424 RepID=A0A2H3BM54_9AGAR|nr:hypothetical protein EV421DRAFT_1737063 [Armillaria borealis]PBK64126.1 hypothetical protein ARMSODRAFT_962256 [Armillaria solidipes]
MDGPHDGRERKHACTMCHKRFDRPSTLKKHLLVHTGEKAYQCETCGRRFGVASNLNRHVKRCILKPVNASLPALAAARSSGTPSPTPPTRSSPSSQAKRRRRAPSPTIWIPYSLRAYNVVLSGHVSCPALPVSPSAYDERDSYDSQVGVNPYHPKDWAWKPRLPGPAVILGVGFGVGLKEEWEESAGMGWGVIGRVAVY